MRYIDICLYVFQEKKLVLDMKMIVLYIDLCYTTLLYEITFHYIQIILVPKSPGNGNS